MESSAPLTRFWVFYSKGWGIIERLVGEEHRWGVRRKDVQTYLRNQGFGYADRILWVASDVKSVVGTATVGSQGFTGQAFRLENEQYQEFRLAEVDLWPRSRWKPKSVLENCRTELRRTYMANTRSMSKSAFNHSVGGSAALQLTPRRPSHKELVNMISEMGRWERFDTRAEEAIGTSRFDVTWRLVPHGEPRRVYEVELGQNISAALTRLKDASDRWNSAFSCNYAKRRDTRPRTTGWSFPCYEDALRNHPSI